MDNNKKKKHVIGNSFVKALINIENSSNDCRFVRVCHCFPFEITPLFDSGDYFFDLLLVVYIEFFLLIVVINK